MYTIRELSQRSGLSRTTLLYYESIGLLVADSRSSANYRQYSEESIKRLERICTYRDAGVPLAEIVQILSYENDVEREVLEKTLAMLNVKAQQVRDSQEKVSALLHQEMLPTLPFIGIDIKSVMEALTPLGFDDDIYLQIHQALDEKSPENHRAFLDLCGFSDDDIERILTSIHKQQKVETDHD
jgi:DNA-binding transcriptional MerR regulator